MHILHEHDLRIHVLLLLNTYGLRLAIYICTRVLLIFLGFYAQFCKGAHATINTKCKMKVGQFLQHLGMQSQYFIFLVYNLHFCIYKLFLISFCPASLSVWISILANQNLAQYISTRAQLACINQSLPFWAVSLKR